MRGCLVVVIVLLLLASCVAILAAIAIPNFLEAQTRAQVGRRAPFEYAPTDENGYYVKKAEDAFHVGLISDKHDVSVGDVTRSRKSVFTFGVLGLGGLLFLLLLVMLAGLLRGGSSKKENEARQEEDGDIQELYRGFEDLSKRIESLETILMDTPMRKR